MARSFMYGSFQNLDEMKQTSPSSDQTSSKRELSSANKNNSVPFKAIRSNVNGLLETSFEYEEDACGTSSSPEKADSGRREMTKRRLLSIAVTDVSKRRKSWPQRLVRRSVSCQHLSIRQRENIFSNSHESVAHKNGPTSKTVSQTDLKNTKVIVHDNHMKQKSLSLSHLRKVTKGTDGSTSESECSTSGCYVDSSTGSDADLERMYFGTRTPAIYENKDIVHELNSSHLKVVGRSFRRMDEHKKFAQKIVSV